MAYRQYPLLESEKDRVRGFHPHTLKLVRICINQPVEFSRTTLAEYPVRMVELGEGGPLGVRYLKRVEADMLLNALPSWKSKEHVRRQLRRVLSKAPNLHVGWTTWNP
jgi:hypothetical protein